MTNPIIPGFAPDPSIVRVDGWFFLVTSSFHLFPGLPVYASQDLSSWEHIGNAINRREQLSLSASSTVISHPGEATQNVPMFATAGLYAPTIRYHVGTFYVVCTNAIRRPDGTNKKANFIVSTTDIREGTWSDPVYFDFDGIDPDILFDEDGKTYISGSAVPGPHTTINCFQIDINTGAKLSKERIIWRGSGGVYPEGPHIYKRNGWYHVVIAEGGTHQTHMVTAARAKDIWGPYEPYPANPILTAYGKDEYIQHTGHCDAFEDEKGQWWAVCLGVRKDKAGRFIMGRETFLTPGNWGSDWLTLDVVKSNPIGGRESSSLSAAPTVDFVYIRDPNAENYKFEESTISIISSSIDFPDSHNSPTFIGKRQRRLQGKSAVTIPMISPDWGAARLKCGIAYYKDELRFFRIFFDAHDSAIVFEIVNQGQEIHRVVRSAVKDIHNGISFRLEYTEVNFRLLYGLGTQKGTDWITLAEFDTLEMTDLDFVGPVIGIFAVANESSKVELKDFQVE